MLVGIPPYYNENIQKLYENIQKGKLKIPKYLSKTAKSCLVVSLSVRLSYCCVESTVLGSEEKTIHGTIKVRPFLLWNRLAQTFI